MATSFKPTTLKKGFPKTGKRSGIAAIYVQCPYCDGDCCGPNGSLMITPGDGDRLRCIDCQSDVRRPRIDGQ